MSSATGLKCPECGLLARDERSLLRTRRRWRTLSLALILLAAGSVLAVWPHARRSGWMSLAPASLLAQTLPMVSKTSEARQELERRLGLAAWPDGSRKATITEAELIALVRRIARGTLLARPADARWEESYGSLWDALRAQAYVLSSAPDKLHLGQTTYGPSAIAAFEELLALPVEIKLATRARVPSGMEVPIRAQIKHRFPQWFMDDMKLDWRVDESGPLTPQGFRGYCTLKIPGEGKRVLTGTLTTLAESYLTRKKHAIETRPVKLEVEIGGTIDEVLTPVRSPEVDSLLATTVLVDVQEWGVCVWPAAPPDATYDDCAFGMKFTLYDGETKLMTGYSNWTGVKGKYGGEPSCGNMTNLVSRERLKELLVNADQHPLELRVESHPDSAIEQLEATRYWSGSFTVPVNTVPRR